MIIDGLELPETSLLQFIGERCVIIDQLNYQIQVKDEQLRLLVEELAVAKHELASLKMRVSDLADKING